MTVRRGQVWLVNLDPTVGSEIRKTCPGVIVSPDELNEHLRTVVVVPLTTGLAYPFRIPTRVRGTDGVAAVDQVRTVDRKRLVKRVSTVRPPKLQAILNALVEMFS
jgi:mRNA interferase MazF